MVSEYHFIITEIHQHNHYKALLLWSVHGSQDNPPIEGQFIVLLYNIIIIYMPSWIYTDWPKHVSMCGK